MSGAADLINHDVLRRAPAAPLVMTATVLDADAGRLRVRVPELDAGTHAYNAFGHFPDAAAGDELRVMIDHYGGVVAVAWEPA